jgi:hypothetical protein
MLRQLDIASKQIQRPSLSESAYLIPMDNAIQLEQNCHCLAFQWYKGTLKLEVKDW